MGTIKATNIDPIAANGTVTLGSSGDTITVPTGVTVGGGMANTPAFYAYLSSTQSVTNGANTKVQINTEIFDSDNAFDNSSNYRFTPQTAGKYMVYVSLCGATDGYRIYQITPKVYKNGSSYATTSEVIQDDVFNRFTTNLETVVDMNGSSDYLEFYGFVDIHANNNELFIGGSSKSTYFGAYRIIGT